MGLFPKAIPEIEKEKTAWVSVIKEIPQVATRDALIAATPRLHDPETPFDQSLTGDDCKEFEEMVQVSMQLTLPDLNKFFYGALTTAVLAACTQGATEQIDLFRWMIQGEMEARTMVTTCEPRLTLDSKCFTELVVATFTISMISSIMGRWLCSRIAMNRFLDPVASIDLA